MGKEQKTELTATAVRVAELVDKASKGELRIPPFQRPLRWKTRHVVDLFDSIFRGFPIGALLVSEGRAAPITVAYGPVRVEAPASDSVWQVIDGQQRVVAIVATLLHPSERPSNDKFAIWFDLEAMTFKRKQTASVPDTWIPLRALRTRRQLMSFMDTSPLKESRPELLDAAFEFADRILEYRVPVYVVRAASENDVRMIFKRTNTSGVNMTESEVFDALSGPGPKPLEVLSSQLSNLGMGTLDHKWLLRAYYAVDQGQARLPANGEMAEAPDVSLTARALRLAISFLADDARIPHLDLLPYSMPLLVLGRFFAVHPDPPPRARLLLRRWLWRGAVSAVHGDSSQANVQRNLNTMTDDVWTTVLRLLELVPRNIDYPSSKTPWNIRAAHTQIFALAQIHALGRCDLRDEPNASSLITRLEEDGVNLSNLTICIGDGQTIASRILAVRDDARGLLALDEGVLRALSVSRILLETALSGDPAMAVSERSVHLDTLTHRFLDERTEIHDNDRPSIEVVTRSAS